LDCKTSPFDFVLPAHFSAALWVMLGPAKQNTCRLTEQILYRTDDDVLPIAQVSK